MGFIEREVLKVCSREKFVMLEGDDPPQLVMPQARVPRIDGKAFKTMLVF